MHRPPDDRRMVARLGVRARPTQLTRCRLAGDDHSGHRIVARRPLPRQHPPFLDSPFLRGTVARQWTAPLHPPRRRRGTSAVYVHHTPILTAMTYRASHRDTAHAMATPADIGDSHVFLLGTEPPGRDSRLGCMSSFDSSSPPDTERSRSAPVPKSGGFETTWGVPVEVRSFPDPHRPAPDPGQWIFSVDGDRSTGRLPGRIRTRSR